MNDQVFIVETYDFYGDGTLHPFYFISKDAAREFGTSLVDSNNGEDVLGYNVFTLELKCKN